MDLERAALLAYRSDSPEGAFRAVAEYLAREVSLHCAVWVGPEDGEVVCTHPADARLPAELVEVAAHIEHAEVFPVGALSPAAARRYPDAEMLLLPLRGAGAPAGAMLLLADAGSFGEELEAWEEVAAAILSSAERLRALEQAQRECETHRKRAQEMEALDVLGLATNQTLDPDEVLALVARFTRTLLGAHYATVNTTDGGGGEVRACSSVGLRRGARADDDRFARRVIAAGKPLVLGEGGEPWDPAEFPLHAAEGMRVALGVPLALFGDTFGALVVGYRDGYPVSARDTLLALTLARHAAVAINNARLHAELAERSAELERAYADLHESALLKERFFASMSHELRTPLNGVLGFQTLLLDGEGGALDERGRRYLEKANGAAKNLLHLVDEILDYAKIEAGKITVVRRMVEVRELVQDALANAEPLIGRKNLRLVGPALPELPRVETDPDRVRQILLNLLSNAVKFTEQGEIAVEVRGPGEADGEWLEIRVRDTGPGIAAADHETIFREFEQVSGTKGGTGLGLPISRKLARLLGGDLHVESEPGAGATFVLRLPAQVPASEPAALTARAA